ncbi:hypothetical protein M422DRAFT_157608, partial [Sphaerobolus stellatus SS14]
FLAGSDTTVAVINMLILQLILHPEIQKCVHQELDSVLGSPDSPRFQLPIWDDQSRTPYLKHSFTMEPGCWVRCPTCCNGGRGIS